MQTRWVTVATIALGAAVAPAPAQTFDFENGPQGWTSAGAAFNAQPVDVTGWRAGSIVKLKIGGDYWKNTHYQMGQHGRFLVTSGGLQGDAATGTFTSPEFMLDRSKPYFTVRVGGTPDAANEEVALEVRGPQPPNSSPGDPGYWIVASATGSGVEAMGLVSIRLADGVLGMPARIRAMDDSDHGHINFDYVQFSATAPELVRTPVWGYADFHTHPMAYLAFGGSKTPAVKTIFGKPGGKLADYPSDDGFKFKEVAKDIPYCPPRHAGGYLAEQFINEAQVLPDKLGFSIKAFLFPHGKSGGPDFKDFPNHLMGAHEQMHITQIRRNYDGGLRLMVALAEDNLGAEAITSYIHKGQVDLVPEKVSVPKQIEHMKTLAGLNSDWMQIALSADQARGIIQQNKLAVILGVEVDQLGSYGFETPEQEIDWLWSLGVRAVTPIHAANNRIGGPAIFEPAYNWLTDYLNRTRDPQMPPPAHSAKDATKDEVQNGAYHNAAFFEARPDSGPCEGPTGPVGVGECVMYRLGKLQFRLSVQHPFYALFHGVAWITPTDDSDYTKWPGYGQKNVQGLEKYGRHYIAALMNRGMILDTAHMSDLSVAQTYKLIGDRLAARRPECAGFDFNKVVSKSCDDDAYPAIISHAHFRGQAVYDSTEPIGAFLPSEYDISDSNLEMVRRVGGVVGPFVSEGRISDLAAHESGLHIDNDCGMSSKNYAFSYDYALKRLGGTGVGMATDFSFIPTTVPRFGSEACQGYEPYPAHGGEERRRHPDHYQAPKDRAKRREAQRKLNLYDERKRDCGIDYGGAHPNVPEVCGDAMKPYGMDNRTFDFNTDGLAHFGMVPDLLQDVSNVGLPEQDMDALFSSAEAYLRMWSKVERLAGPR